MDEGHVAGLVYINFAKSIDCVNHRFLLAKPKSYQVHIDGVLPEEAPCLTCVPLGSVIALLLFLLYGNDLPAALGDFAFLFADDVIMVFPQSQSSHLLSSRSSAWAWAWE